MKVQRYSPRETPYAEMIPLPDGQYVRHEDYAVLQAQLEAIGAGGVDGRRLMGDYCRQSRYELGRAALKAQNADAGLDVEAVLRLFLTGDGFIAECDIPHIVAALQSQDSERLDFITSKPGVCYALVSDDSGRWALTDAGMGPVAPDQGFTETVGITSIVDPDMWKSSPREAIDHARRVEGE